MPLIKTLSPETQLKKDLPDFGAGDVVKVHQRIKEVSDSGKERERVQVFEGLVIARKHGSGANATFMVRKITSGVGVERIFPIHSPNIEKIEVVKKQSVSKSKLYYVRNRLGSAPKVRKHKTVKAK